MFCGLFLLSVYKFYKPICSYNFLFGKKNNDKSTFDGYVQVLSTLFRKFTAEQ